jgi:tetratricopeptide (TPR) repeat protein
VESALAIGFLFASHPLHTEAVAFISSRTTLYSTLFGLLAFLCIVIREDKLEKEVNVSEREFSAPGVTRVLKEAKLFCLSLAFFALALFSKEEAAVFPFIFMAYFLIGPLRLNERYTLGRGGRLAAGIPYLLLLGVYIGLRLSVVRGVGISGELADWNVLSSLKMAGTVIGMYFRLLLLPYVLNVDYGTFDLLNTASIFMAALYLVLFVVVVFFVIRKWSQSVFFAMWYIVGLSPFLNIFPIPQYFAERYLYMPSLSFSVATFYFVKHLGDHLSSRLGSQNFNSVLFRRVILIVFLLGYGCVTFTRNGDWKNELALFGHSSEKLPENARARYNYGLALIKCGELDRGISEVQKSIDLNPIVPKSHLALAKAYSRKGDIDSAIREYEVVLRIEPSPFSAHHDLGVLYGKMGEYEEAMYHLQRAREIDPDHFSVHNNLGIVYGKAGRIEDAFASFSTALELKPNDGETLENFGNVLFDEQRWGEALDYYQKAVSSPEITESGERARMYYKIGFIYFEKLNQPSEAVTWWNKFLQSSPTGKIADRVRELIKEIS